MRKPRRALALLGALLGTIIAYLAASAWHRTELSTITSHIPVANLTEIILGLPLAAATE